VNPDLAFPLLFKKEVIARHQWLTDVILAIWESEIRRIKFQGQPGQIVCKTLISKITRAKWTGGVELKW
jgi:hypothetical protein